MGSSASVHNVEVKLVDNSGNMLSQNEINELNNAASELIENNFYEKYHNSNSYDTWKKYLEENEIYRTNFKWN